MSEGSMRRGMITASIFFSEQELLPSVSTTTIEGDSRACQRAVSLS